VVLAGGAYAGIKAIAGGDDESPPAAGNRAAVPPATTADQSKTKRRAPASVPADVRAATTVSVLNGTNATGLAAKVQGQLVAAGYQKGITQNAQGGPTTVVYYASGSQEAARDIARRLKATQVKPIDPQTLAAGGAAKIVVILGQDQAG